MEPRKYRIYLDTCVIGCLFDDDRPHEQELTGKLWTEMRSDTYEVKMESTMDELRRIRDALSLHDLEISFTEHQKELDEAVKHYEDFIGQPMPRATEERQKAA